MARIGTREFRNRLSYYLRRVKQGERIVVTEHGRPIADITPSAVRRTDLEAAWLRAEREGWLTLAKPGKLSRAKPMRLRGKVRVSDQIIEDRG